MTLSGVLECVAALQWFINVDDLDIVSWAMSEFKNVVDGCSVCLDDVDLNVVQK